MEREYFSGKPRHNTVDWRTFQIGRCRLLIHTKLTKEFYTSQPKITENCSCGYCKIF